MLTSMLVKNLAIIDNLQIDFENGMTVLTGETGAGKSLIIDAIGLLFGDRASSDLVRHGENKTIIEGTFVEYSDKVKELLRELDIDDEDVLIIRREIYESGKSIGKINGNSVSVSVLNQIGLELGNIHTQFDTQKLINPNNYYVYLDDENILNKLSIYQSLLKEYKAIDKEYNKLLKSDAENNQKLDFLKYQLNELQKADLNVSEEEELLKEAKVLGNFEKLKNNFIDFNNIFEERNVLDNIYESLGYLEKLSDIDESLITKKNELSEIYYSLNDLVYEISNNFKKRDFDEYSLDNINERLSVYSDLKRKYKMNTIELIEYYNNIVNEVEKLENHDFYLNDALKKKNKLFNEVSEIANEISIIRKNNAEKLINEINKHLKDLQLENTKFEIEFSKENEESSSYFKNNGVDLLEFLVSFNKGEDVKRLGKIASGGELSRFMLAIKTITSQKVKNQTLIFDEIDTGVSGEIAYKIAEKIKEISNYSQVLCVTHLPQVAAISDHHYNISKNIVNDKTVTNIETLSYERRVQHIAGMISKGVISEAAVLMAKELLK